MVGRYAVIALYVYFYVHIHYYIKADGVRPLTKKSLQLANHQGTSGAVQNSWDQWANLAPGMSAGSWLQ